MYFVYACKCGNASVFDSKKKNLTQAKCKICEKSRSVKKERPLYKGDDFHEAVYTRRLWIEKRRRAGAI